MLDRYDGIGKRGNLVDIAEQHHNRRGRRGGDALHRRIEFAAGFDIKPDIGVVENEEVGSVEELVDDKHLAQLTARKAVDRLVLISAKLHLLGKPLPCGLVQSVAHDLADRGDFAVHARFVALLVVFGFESGERVDVAELHIADIEPSAWRDDVVGGEIPAALDDFCQRGLSGSVRPDYHRQTFGDDGAVGIGDGHAGIF